VRFSLKTIGLALLLAFAGCGDGQSSAPASEPPQPAPEPEAAQTHVQPAPAEAGSGVAARGASHYAALCAACHGARVIKNGGSAVGKSPLMAAWGGSLTDAQIRDVIAFIRTLADPPHSPPTG
jgi:mono/diheme cytochrome c family protein